MTITLESSDFSTMNSFLLKERFTTAEHTQLTIEEISNIKPLNSSKSEKICELVLEFFKDGILDVEKFVEIEEYDTTLEIVFVKDWLTKIIPNNTNVIVSWDEENCILTKKDLFCKYWDTFCYPSSDDVVIVPQVGSWVLSYYHYEKFQFGTRRTKG